MGFVNWLSQGLDMSLRVHSLDDRYNEDGREIAETAKNRKRSFRTWAYRYQVGSPQRKCSSSSTQTSKPSVNRSLPGGKSWTNAMLNLPQPCVRSIDFLLSNIEGIHCVCLTYARQYPVFVLFFFHLSAFSSLSSSYCIWSIRKKKTKTLIKMMNASHTGK